MSSNDEESDYRKYSKQWVREQYDGEHQVATPTAQLAKLIHEWHIAIPGCLVAFLPAAVLVNTGAPLREVVMAYLGVSGTGYAVLFSTLWCSTLAGADTTDGE